MVAQPWPAPIPTIGHAESDVGLDVVGNELRMHFNDHAQQDPEAVLEVLRRLWLNAL